MNMHGLTKTLVPAWVSLHRGSTLTALSLFAVLAAVFCTAAHSWADGEQESRSKSESQQRQQERVVISLPNGVREVRVVEEGDREVITLSRTTVGPAIRVPGSGGFMGHPALRRSEAARRAQTDAPRQEPRTDTAGAAPRRASGAPWVAAVRSRAMRQFAAASGSGLVVEGGAGSSTGARRVGGWSPAGGGSSGHVGRGWAPGRGGDGGAYLSEGRPAMPSHVEVHDLGEGKAKVLWRINSGDELGFEVQRVPSFNAPVIVGKNVTAYIDQPGAGDFQYRVRSYNAFGPSAWTRWASGRVSGGDGGDWDPWANLHDITGQPMTEDGWTDWLALYQHPDLYTDSRIVYVSSSTGSDSNGRWYYAGHAAVGEDPFDPVGPIQPYRTLDAAYDQLRDGYPDMLLLKRGDEWDEGLSGWMKSGRQVHPDGWVEWMIVGTYGSDAQRPRIERWSTGVPTSYLAVMGFEVWRGLAKDNSGEYFFAEDIASVMDPGITEIVSGLGVGRGSNNYIRRCIVSNYTDNGLFAFNVLGTLFIEETLVDNCGRTEDHNVYIGQNLDASLLYTRGNIISRVARSNNVGLGQRGGGRAENNLMIGQARISSGFNQWAPDFFKPVEWINNVLIHGRGRGGTVGQIKPFTMIGNVIAHKHPDAIAEGGAAVILGGGGSFTGDVTMTDNVFYDWPMNPSSSGGQLVNFASGHLDGFATISDNILQQPVQGNLISADSDNIGMFSISSNTYWSGNPTNSWFFPGGSFSNWASQVGDSGSVVEQVDFPDANRTIKTYMESLGYSPSNLDHAIDMFVEESLKQSRFNWRPEFTAAAVNAYIREGFGLPADGVSSD